MPQVTVWKCPHTRKIFEDRIKYSSHLEKIRELRRIRRRLNINEEIENQRWFEIRNAEISVSDLPDLIIKNQDLFWADAAKNKSNSFHWRDVGNNIVRGKVIPIPKLVEFESFVFQWQDRLSNSHSCPVNGVTNWYGHTDLPTGYPGWCINAKWKIFLPPEFRNYYTGGDLFKGTKSLIHSHSGSGGHRSGEFSIYRYQLSIFADDWPGLFKYHDKQRMWEILSKPY